jgi:hypothetical protein
MTVGAIDLPEGVRIRRLSDREITSIIGGPASSFGDPFRDEIGLHEFCIETIVEETKRFDSHDIAAQLDVASKFSKAILALRTYRDGAVGYGRVRCIPVTCCPLLLLSYGRGDAYVPLGRYALESSEIADFLEHANLVFRLTDAPMSIACSRLADSGMRANSRDRLIDAVIGMEALLLAGLQAEDRRGELRYRFALHYSTMFKSPQERYEAFRLAKELYDLRSAAAHGSTLRSKQIQTLASTAVGATEILRRLVREFLPLAEQSPYRDLQFWERRYFGLPSPE